MIGMLFDVIVLGSELSGLIAGSLLVKRGMNVLMVEVEEQEQAIARDGYRLRRFPGAFYGFGKNQIFSEIFTELGIPFLDKKRFLPADPAFQVAMPGRRIDMPQDREAVFRMLGDEFPSESGKIMAMINEMDRFAQVIRGFFSADVVYPPHSFGEKMAVRKMFGSDSDVYREAMKTTYEEFLAGFDLSGEARAFLDAQIQLLSPIYPDRTTLALAANHIGLVNGGVFRVEGGTKVLQGLFKERISAYRGKVHRSPSVESVEFRKYIEVKLSDQKEAVRARYLLVADNPARFFKAHIPKLMKSDFKDKLAVPPPRCHDFVLYVGVDANVIPVGMEPSCVMIPDPQKPLVDDNLLMINVSVPGDESLAPAGKRLVAVRMKVCPENDRLDLKRVEELADRVMASLGELMPFLDDFLDFVAVKESFKLYQAERDEAWTQAVDDDRLGVALLHNRTANKEVYYTGPAVLPALGMEGEAISARTVANILSGRLEKK